MHVSAGLRYSARDEELRTRVFRCADPESLENLTTDRPSSPDGYEPEYDYDLTPRRGDDRLRIRCVHCRRTNHWKGFVIKHSDGRRALVGGTCGRKRYGASFNTKTREFDRQILRQRQLDRLHSVMINFDPLLTFLMALRRHASVAQFGKLHFDMEAAMEPLHRRLRSEVPSRRGSLLVTERVRDIAAEANRRDGRQTFVEHERQFGQLAGWEVFCPSGEMVSQNIIDVHHRALGFSRVIKERPNSTQWTQEELTDFFMQLTEMTERIERQLEVINVYRIAVSPPNLRLIAAWAAERPDIPGTWSAGDLKLLWKKEDGSVTALSVPAPAEPLDLAPLVAFSRALRMQHAA